MIEDVENNKKKIIKLRYILMFLLIVGIIIGIYLWMTREKSKIVWYFLDDVDTGFLTTTNDESTKYQLFDTYEEYIEMYESIDQWAEDFINNISDPRLDMSSFERMKESQREKVIANKNKRYGEYFKELYFDERVKKIKEGFSEGNYTENFFKRNSLLLVENLTFNAVVHEHKVEDICKNGNILNVQIKKSSGGSVGGGEGVLHLITVSKKQLQGVEKINVNINNTSTSEPGIAYKPIIYLYPTEETEVQVKLGNDENITVSYPKYIDGWNVIAKPNGTLTDLTTNRELYALYYENENVVSFDVTNEGFVIKGEDTAAFLEEKLSLLGLTEREAEEFIIYWLPQLEENKYNYIRFSTEEEINKNMPLEITPEPDSIIRILMTFKKLEKPISVEEQEIITPTRDGFTVVEWGGTEIK